MRTASEGFFEHFCDQKGMRWKRVAEADIPTPDYDIFVPRRKIVVEVKEIVPNEEETQAQEELAEKGFVIGSVTPGQRVRKKISEAAQQIKNRTKRRYPRLLVLFDRGFVAGHLDPYHIRVAMYGFETVQFAVPRDPQITPYPVGAKYGPKRKMTPEHNTSISAIGVLHASGPGAIQLTLYHNAHASIPLEPMLLGQYGIAQFRLAERAPGVIPGWEQIQGFSKP